MKYTLAILLFVIGHTTFGQSPVEYQITGLSKHGLLTMTPYQDNLLLTDHGGSLILYSKSEKRIIDFRTPGDFAATTVLYDSIKSGFWIAGDIVITNAAELRFYNLHLDLMFSLPLPDNTTQLLLLNSTLLISDDNGYLYMYADKLEKLNRKLNGVARRLVRQDNDIVRAFLATGEIVDVSLNQQHNRIKTVTRCFTVDDEIYGVSCTSNFYLFDGSKHMFITDKYFRTIHQVKTFRNYLFFDTDTSFVQVNKNVMNRTLISKDAAGLYHLDKQVPFLQIDSLFPNSINKTVGSKLFDLRKIIYDDQSKMVSDEILERDVTAATIYKNDVIVGTKHENVMVMGKTVNSAHSFDMLEPEVVVDFGHAHSSKILMTFTSNNSYYAYALSGKWLTAQKFAHRPGNMIIMDKYEKVIYSLANYLSFEPLRTYTHNAAKVNELAYSQEFGNNIKKVVPDFNEGRLIVICDDLSIYEYDVPSKKIILKINVRSHLGPLSNTGKLMNILVKLHNDTLVDIFNSRLTILESSNEEYLSLKDSNVVYIVEINSGSIKKIQLADTEEPGQIISVDYKNGTAIFYSLVPAGSHALDSYLIGNVILNYHVDNTTAYLCDMLGRLLVFSIP